MSAALNSVVDRAFSTGEIKRRIGVMSVEYVQSMDDTPVYGIGSTKVHLRKPHGEVVQPEAVTEWIRKLPINPENS